MTSAQALSVSRSPAWRSFVLFSGKKTHHKGTRNCGIQREASLYVGLAFPAPPRHGPTKAFGDRHPVVDDDVNQVRLGTINPGTRSHGNVVIMAVVGGPA